MSYSPYKNEDSISEYISQCNDLKLILDNMLSKANSFHKSKSNSNSHDNYNDDSIVGYNNSENDEIFNWFHKAIKMNKRKTIEFIDLNSNKFSSNELEYFSQFRPKTYNINDYLD